MKIENLRIQHCTQCGGTGKVFNNVPGSIIAKVRLTEVTPPYGYDCDVCHGTGHIIHQLREE